MGGCRGTQDLSRQPPFSHALPRQRREGLGGILALSLDFAKPGKRHTAIPNILPLTEPKGDPGS